MSVEIDKCVFDAMEVPFLGSIVSGSRLRMDREKAKPITNWPRPTTKNKVQQLMGLWNVNHQFVPGNAAIVFPILLRGKDKDIIWGEAQESAILKMMILFTSGKSPILSHYDPNRPRLSKN